MERELIEPVGSSRVADYPFHIRRIRGRVPKYVTTATLSFVALACIYPIVFTFINSFKTRTGYARDPLGLPTEVNFDNYQEVISRMELVHLVFNSTITTLGGVLLTVGAGFLAAYAITKINFPGAKIALFFIIATLAVPSQAIIFPLFETMRTLGFTGEYQGLILSLASFGLPLCVYLLTAYLRSIPSDIVDAARVDGAGHLRIMSHVMFPIARPAIAALTILNFVWMWNDLLLPLVIMGVSGKTSLMVGVARLSGEYDISVPLISAGLVIALMPVLIVYLVFQRMILGGAMSGAVK